MKPINIAFLLVGLILTVVVIGALVYGITTHTEPGLMEATPGFGPSDTPIRVCVAAYVDEEDVAAVDAVVVAINTTNDRLGFGALELAQNGLCTHGIRGTIGVPEEHGGTSWTTTDPGGATTFAPGSRECVFTTTNNGPGATLGLDIQHELGHCLGLAHDCWAGSIMCGDEDNDPSNGSCCTLAPTPDGQYPPRIDDSDRDTLRHLFGH